MGVTGTSNEAEFVWELKEIIVTRYELEVQSVKICLPRLILIDIHLLKETPPHIQSLNPLPILSMV
jgi:hypothetical protein